MLAQLPAQRLTLLFGSYAQKRYLPAGRRANVPEIMRAWAALGPDFFPLPHPSWRSAGWMQRNPWFTTDVLPVLKSRVAALLSLRVESR